MFNIFKKTAVIVKSDQVTGKTEVSRDIESIQKANQASSASIAAEGGIVIDREVNEHDGHDTTYLAPTHNWGVWHQTLQSVIPSSELE